MYCLLPFMYLLPFHPFLCLCHSAYASTSASSFPLCLHLFIRFASSFPLSAYLHPICLFVSFICISSSFMYLHFLYLHIFIRYASSFPLSAYLHPICIFISFICISSS